VFASASRDARLGGGGKKGEGAALIQDLSLVETKDTKCYEGLPTSVVIKN